MEFMKIKTGLKILFLLPAIATVFSGCDNKKKTNVSEGSKNQILHIGNGTEPQDLDPHIVTGVPEHRIISALLEGLVIEDPVSLSPLPGMAVSWTVSEDGRVYTFKIRENARWSNGDPLNAEDFVYSWKRLLSPGLASEYAYQLYFVKNAEKYNKGEITDFSQVGATAPDKSTFRVTLKSPVPYFLSLLTHYSTFPVHRKTVEKFGKIDTRGTKWTRPGNFVGNGPFLLKEWKLNKIIIVEKNPTYRDAEKIKLNGVHFHPIDNKQTEERMFRSGGLHLTSSIPSGKIETYKEKAPQLLKITPYLGTYYYLINTQKKPFDDRRIRRAFAMSIDRKKIVEKVTKGGQLPAGSFTPPDTRGYTPESSIPFDIEGAKKLLAEAGYPDGKGFPDSELLYNTSEDHRKIAVAIQQMWKTALNVNVSLINQDWKVYLDSRKTKNYQLARAGWIGDYPDPNTFLEMYVADSGNNHSGWSNKTYDDLIARASETVNPAARYRLFQRAETILLEEAPIIPIYTYTNTYLISPDVKGWHPNILDHHPYQFVSLTPAEEK